MSEPICTCTELQRMTVCHDYRNEPHVVGCPRWGMPKYDVGGVVPPGPTRVVNDSGQDEEVRPSES